MRHKHPLTEIIQSLIKKKKKLKRGNAEERCWSVCLREKTRRTPSNPQTPQRLCEVEQEHEYLSPRGVMLVHQLWAHTHARTFRNKCVCNYSLAGSCFLISSTSDNRKGDTQVFFLYKGNYVHSLGIKRLKMPCGRSEVERSTSVHLNLPLLLRLTLTVLKMYNSTFISCLYTL